jgi:hypothetical protein
LSRQTLGRIFPGHPENRVDGGGGQDCSHGVACILASCTLAMGLGGSVCETTDAMYILYGDWRIGQGDSHSESGTNMFPVLS